MELLVNKVICNHHYKKETVERYGNVRFPQYYLTFPFTRNDHISTTFLKRFSRLLIFPYHLKARKGQLFFPAVNARKCHIFTLVPPLYSVLIGLNNSILNQQKVIHTQKCNTVKVQKMSVLGVHQYILYDKLYQWQTHCLNVFCVL